MVGQFAEDVLFIELLDASGELRMSDRDALFTDGAGGPSVGLGGDAEARGEPAGPHLRREVGEAVWVEVPCRSLSMVCTMAPCGSASRAIGSMRSWRRQGPTSLRVRQLTRGIGLLGLGLLLLCLVGVVWFARSSRSRSKPHRGNRSGAPGQPGCADRAGLATRLVRSPRRWRRWWRVWTGTSFAMRLGGTSPASWRTSWSRTPALCAWVGTRERSRF